MPRPRKYHFFFRILDTDHSWKELIKSPPTERLPATVMVDKDERPKFLFVRIYDDVYESTVWEVRGPRNNKLTNDEWEGTRRFTYLKDAKRTAIDRAYANAGIPNPHAQRSSLSYK